MKKNKFIAIALTAVVAGIAVQTASAENPNYAPGDLVLYFQQEGGNNTVYLSLGNAALTYRGNASGPDVSNMLNIININSNLETAFGTNWATLTNLYVGLAGVSGTSTTATAQINRDPTRTLYVGQPRQTVGIIGQPDSNGYVFNSNTGMTTAANNINAFALPFDDASGTNGYTTASVVSPTSVSQIDDQNPFSQPGTQGLAFNTFGGGIQQVGSAGVFGSDFGGVSNVEFALDLYRIQSSSTQPNQVGFGEAARTGTYEGTVVLNSTGDVSFLAVPEPSSYALMGLGAIGLFFGIARRKKLAA